VTTGRSGARKEGEGGCKIPPPFREGPGGVSRGGLGSPSGGPAGPLGVPLIKLMPGVRECLTAEFMPALRTGLAYQSVLARGNREINSVGFDKAGIQRCFSREGAFTPRVHRDPCEKEGFPQALPCLRQICRLSCPTVFVVRLVRLPRCCKRKRLAML
jgi:hypothetical protein